MNNWLTIILYFIFVAGVWYLKVTIPKMISAAYSKELEHIKAILESQRTKSEILAGKASSLYDEVLTIIGEFKTIDFGNSLGMAPSADVKWLNERIYKLELFAQTWWPYFISGDLRDLTLKFRESIEAGCVYDKTTKTTSISKSAFWDPADKLQKAIQDELEFLFGPKASVYKIP